MPTYNVVVTKTKKMSKIIAVEADNRKHALVVARDQAFHTEVFDENAPHSATYSADHATEI
jgi:UPF0288 family protein (methanogenesis marker protein 3)